MIHHINLRVIVHSTEDKSKVMDALDLFLKHSLKDQYSLLYEKIVNSIDGEGHYGNPLSIFSVQLTRKDHIKAFSVFVRQNLDSEDIYKLRCEMSDRLDDEQLFHMRFDKQSAYFQKVKLTCSSDAIIAKIKIETYPRNRLVAGKIVEELFG